MNYHAAKIEYPLVNLRVQHTQFQMILIYLPPACGTVGRVSGD
jgi:hypothetical protein